MNSDSGQPPADKGVRHLNEGERLPVAPVSSPGAEVVKQIIEQILANERRRARLEFLRLSVFALVFLFALLATGLWFGRQLLGQLREERRLSEQSWQMMIAGLRNMQTAPFPADAPHPRPPDAANQIAQTRSADGRLDLEFNVGQHVGRGIPAEPAERAAYPRRERGKPEGLPRVLRGSPYLENSHRPAKSDFIVAPIAEDLSLRLPIPSL